VRTASGDDLFIHSTSFTNHPPSPPSPAAATAATAAAAAAAADTEICSGGGASSCSTTAGGAGAAGDFILIVTAKATGSCSGSVLAYASKCYQGSGALHLDRPVAGYVNFCPALLDTAKAEYPSQLSTAIHEVTHALVFSSSLYPWCASGVRL
jgi:hypothetical protein